MAGRALAASHRNRGQIRPGGRLDGRGPDVTWSITRLRHVGKSRIPDNSGEINKSLNIAVG
jgi:hypothetical protein